MHMHYDYIPKHLLSLTSLKLHVMREGKKKYGDNKPTLQQLIHKRGYIL